MNRYKTSAFGIIIVALVFGFLLFRNDFFDSKTTSFNKEVTEKIQTKEVTDLMLSIPTNERILTINKKENIGHIFQILSSINLKKVNKLTSNYSEMYSILITVQGEMVYYVNLYDNKDLSIIDLKNGKIQRYKVENSVDLNEIRKYWVNQ